MPSAAMLDSKYKAFCPVCQERLTAFDYHAAYMVEVDGGWPVGGTVIVTGAQVAAGNEPVLQGRLLSSHQPFQAEDHWIFQPCGHTFTGEMQLDFTVDWKEQVKEEEALKLKLVRLVMARLHCRLEAGETGLTTCTKHCASVEDWGALPASANVCLHAVTQADFMGGE